MKCTGEMKTTSLPVAAARPMSSTAPSLMSAATSTTARPGRQPAVLGVKARQAPSTPIATGPPAPHKKRFTVGSANGAQPPEGKPGQVSPQFPASPVSSPATASNLRAVRAVTLDSTHLSSRMSLLIYGCSIININRTRLKRTFKVPKFPEVFFRLETAEKRLDLTSYKSYVYGGRGLWATVFETRTVDSKRDRGEEEWQIVNEWRKEWRRVPASGLRTTSRSRGP